MHSCASAVAVFNASKSISRILIVLFELTAFIFGQQALGIFSSDQRAQKSHLSDATIRLAHGSTYVSVDPDTQCLPKVDAGFADFAIAGVAFCLD